MKDIIDSHTRPLIVFLEMENIPEPSRFKWLPRMSPNLAKKRVAKNFARKPIRLQFGEISLKSNGIYITQIQKLNTDIYKEQTTKIEINNKNVSNLQHS